MSIHSLATAALALGFCCTTAVHSNALAHAPVEFLEVIRVRPANRIEHGVDLQSTIDEQRVATKLIGPELIARTVAGFGRGTPGKPAYLTWYRIGNPVASSPRTLSVLDRVRGENGTRLTLGDAEYVLSPAQRILSGPPEQIPDGLDHYVAYRIVDAKPLQMSIEIRAAETTQRREVSRPLYCCLAAKQWHHEDFIDVTHPRDCFVVYEMDSQSNDEKLSTIDQFGMNRLRATESQWLGVRAAVFASQNE